MRVRRNAHYIEGGWGGGGEGEVEILRIPGSANQAELLIIWKEGSKGDSLYPRKEREKPKK